MLLTTTFKLAINLEVRPASMNTNLGIVETLDVAFNCKLDALL